LKHLLILLISFLLLSSPLFGQSERPETIIIPVSSLGDVSEVRKQILQNTLTDELKKYFRIVLQEKYEQVLEQVFEELDYEECSEDTCIMRVQEMLQVENVFNLQIIGEGEGSQLNLKWITLDEKKNEEDYCKGCGTIELREMIGGLVEKLVGVKEVEQPMVLVQKKPILKRKETGILYRDTPRTKWIEGGRKWFRSGNEHTQGKFKGEIVNGVPHGRGTTIFPDGGKYVGEFMDGEKYGHGSYTFPDGEKYVGGFKNGTQNGQGTYTWTNGNKYKGEWKDGRENGQGTYTKTSGHKYEGEWKNGKYHGPGILFLPDGGKGVGEFKMNRPWNVIMYDENGKYVGRVVNGALK